MNRLIRGLLLMVMCSAVAATLTAQRQMVKAKVRSGPPSWTRGIVPIDRESYYNAVECGKQGGQDPPCVYWDTGMCRNEEFELTFQTGYKMVAYAVWNAVKQNKPAPTPDYADAQRTRVTVAVRALRPKDNAVVDAHVMRNRQVFQPVSRAPTGVDTRFTFDYPVWAPTSDIEFEVVGKKRPLLCTIAKSELEKMR